MSDCEPGPASKLTSALIERLLDSPAHFSLYHRQKDRRDAANIIIQFLTIARIFVKPYSKLTDEQLQNISEDQSRGNEGHRIGEHEAAHILACRRLIDQAGIRGEFY